jgi:hypothetical protein
MLISLLYEVYAYMCHSHSAHHTFVRYKYDRK